MSLPGRLLTLTTLAFVPVLLVLLGLGSGGNSSNLGLVVRLECGDCLVEGGGGDLLGDDRDRHGLSRQVHSVRRLKDVFISVGVEIHVTNVTSHIYRELHGPKGLDVAGATAPHQLGRRLLANIIHQLVAQLRGESDHCSGKRLLISILRFFA